MLGMKDERFLDVIPYGRFARDAQRTGVCLDEAPVAQMQELPPWRESPKCAA
jgi:hypothetical protein